MENYTITTVNGRFEFYGEYIRELETNNWHYYQKSNGIIIHFRKKYIIAIEGGTIDTVMANKVNK